MPNSPPIFETEDLFMDAFTPVHDPLCAPQDGLYHSADPSSCMSIESSFTAWDASANQWSVPFTSPLPSPAPALAATPTPALEQAPVPAIAPVHAPQFGDVSDTVSAFLPTQPPQYLRSEGAELARALAEYCGVDMQTSAISIDASSLVATKKARMEDGSLMVTSDGESSSAMGDAEKPRRSKWANEEEKRADRRRRNREASARSYYNRKKRVDKLHKDLNGEKEKAKSLFMREIELKRENALLKQRLWIAVGSPHF